MKILAYIQIPPTTIFIDDDGKIHFTADADIDTDGTGDHHGDKTAQNETTLKLNGRNLNADEDKFIVVPPVIIQSVDPIVLGCQARVFYRGNMTDAVVGDVGPHKKIGEVSRATAIALGINPDPNRGGAESGVTYAIWPGKPAIVDGKQYSLQAS